MEVSEADFAAIVILGTKGGDKEQVLGIPGGAVRFVGRGALLDDEVGEDAAQEDDGEFLLVELDEEDAPGLVGGERASWRMVFTFAASSSLSPRSAGS